MTTTTMRVPLNMPLTAMILAMGSLYSTLSSLAPALFEMNSATPAAARPELAQKTSFLLGKSLAQSLSSCGEPHLVSARPSTPNLVAIF